MINPSIMVLVKNEAYWLPYVLKQTEGFFDSYVIYDVGSTDNTREIITWWVDRMKNKAEICVRYLPHVDPKVQGTFRNSMIVEGQRDCYMILDGDELYKKTDMAKIKLAANNLINTHKFNKRIKFGVFRRVEVNDDLTKQYHIRRSHHRLYTKDAYWTGTHPGEAPAFAQNKNSEMWFDDIIVWHMHNTVRSPKEKDATRRLQRKSQGSYHTGELIDLNLLKELPVLQHRIENFPVSPMLEALWG